MELTLQQDDARYAGSYALTVEVRFSDFPDISFTNSAKLLVELKGTN